MYMAWLLGGNRYSRGFIAALPATAKRKPIPRSVTVLSHRFSACGWLLTMRVCDKPVT